MIDFDIHGIVRVRLLDPTPHDVDAVAKLLGPTQPATGHDADITIRFEDISTVPGLRFLGLNSTGFTSEAFYVLSWRTGQIEARIPFEKIGNQCEIVCQSGLDSIPLLFEMVNLAFMKKNYLPLHASAFLFDGVGILATGWTKGGKTEALLSFAQHGAHYIGDEWIVLSPDGHTMFGLPFPVTLWDWQFKYIPNLMPRVSIQKRLLFTSIHCLDAFHRTFGRGKLRSVPPLNAIGQVLPALRRRLKIVISPQILFQDCYCRSGATVDKLFLMMSHNAPEVKIERCHPMEVAQRMRYSNEAEQIPFLEYYKAFQFAFPNLRNEFLDRHEELQSSLLRHALEGKEAYKVLHPYPVSFDALFEILRPVCQKQPCTLEGQS